MGDDPAYWRSLLIAERSVARREIAVALLMLARIDRRNVIFEKYKTELDALYHE